MTIKKTYSMIEIKPKTKSELSNNLRKLHEETLVNLKYSKANNTIRAYKSDFNDFSLFCSQNGFNPIPSNAKIVSLYLTY